MAERKRAPGGATISIFTCGKAKAPRCSQGCGREATLACEYPLTGRATGTSCGKDLCVGCAVNVTQVAHLTKGESFDLCRAHADYDRAQRRKAQLEQDAADGVGPVAGVRAEVPRG